MNINPGCQEVNNTIETLTAPYKENIQPEEMDWIKKALSDIKNADKSIKVQERVSRQLNALETFSPDQIVHLVNILQQGIQQESNDAQIQAELCQKVAGITYQKKISLDKFVRESVDKNFAINVIVQQVKQGKLYSLHAAECLLKCGLPGESSEIQHALIEIAKLGAQQDGGDLSMNIHNFGIDFSNPEGQLALIEIAKLAAQQCGVGVSQYIQDYGIDASTTEGKQALIEIAKLAAQQDGFGTSQYIQNYGIDASTTKGKQALIEIAKLAAQNSCLGVSIYIKNYGIDASTPEGQQALVEIAKLAAQRNGDETSKNIQNYGIDASKPEGQNALIEIAKLAAQQDGKGISEFIKLYRVDASTHKGKQALIEIAKLAAQKHGWGTSLYIQNYGIDASTPEGQQALIEIAKLAAQQDGAGISYFISNYRINASTPEGQKALFEIAKMALLQNVSEALPNLQNYPLDTQSEEGKKRYLELTQLVFTCVVKQFHSFKYSDFNMTFYDYCAGCNGNGVESYHIDLHQLDAPHQQLQAEDLSGALNKCLDLAAAVFEMSSDQLQWVQDRMSSIKDKVEKDNLGEDKAETDKKVKAEQTEFLEQWMCLCSLCASRGDLKQMFKQNGPLFERLFQLSPALRIRIMHEMIVASIDPNSLFVKTLKAELSKKPSVIDKIKVLPRDLRMTVAEIFLRGCHNGQANRVNHLRENASDIIHAQLACFILADFPMQGLEVYLKVLNVITKDRSLRDAKYQQPLLAALVAIKNSSLQDDIRIKLLVDIFTHVAAKDRVQGLKLITDILNFGGESYLGETIDLASLKATLERLFVDKCKVHLDGFGDLYQNTVGEWRGKEALITYAGKHVGNPKALPYFQQFLTSVLQGNFTQIRYAVENNPHLEQIKKSHLKVFEAWQKPVNLTAAEVTSKDTVKEIPVETMVVENLKQAVANHHLGLELQEALFPILSACIGNWNSLDTSLKLIEQQLEPLANRRLTPEELSQNKRLQLQKYILELILDPSDLEKKLNVLKGAKVKGLEEVLAPFYKDLEDAVQLLHSSQKSSPEELKMMDSDDPNHFLLMGTEVMNSCQNVNGSASLNVGVLGYALDGKHRLALVCGPSGKILARSVLRLLIDAKGNPVLFQERNYVADTSPEYPSLLRKIALKKAELLGVPLVVSSSDFENEEAKPYAYEVEAKDKPVPFEYVDALEGLQSGAYKIGKTQQIR